MSTGESETGKEFPETGKNFPAGGAGASSLITDLQCVAEDDSGHYSPGLKRLCAEAAQALAALAKADPTEQEG